MRKLLSTSLKALAATLAALVVPLGIYLGYLQLSANFATVVSGEVFRSAQPSGTDLQAYAARYGIRSVINLRGGALGKQWYDEEVAASQKLGIAHFDFGMSAGRELTQDQAAKLIALMEAAPKPLLIHCKAGADRSGLASALYVAAVAHGGEEAAESQISLYYGHISLALSSAYTMDRTFEALEPWLGFDHS